MFFNKKDLLQIKLSIEPFLFIKKGCAMSKHKVQNVWIELFGLSCDTSSKYTTTQHIKKKIFTGADLISFFTIKGLGISLIVEQKEKLVQQLVDSEENESK